MTTQNPDNGELGKARHYFEILEKPIPPSRDEAREITEWMLSSPKNVGLYLDVSVIESTLRAAGIAERGTGERWIACAPDAQSPSAVRYSISRPWALAAVFLFVTLLVGVAWLVMRERWTTYVTAPGIARQVQFDEAGAMRIFGGSSLRVRNSSTGVEIRIADGGATFTTKARPQRSLAVEVTGGRIEPKPLPTASVAEIDLPEAGLMPTALIVDNSDAQGIEFNVLRKGNETGVSVTQGRVEVTGHAEPDRMILTVGESTAISTQGHVLPRMHTDESRLLIPSLSLFEVAQIFNRRNTVPQLQVMGRARLQPIGVLVRSDNPAKLVLALQALGYFIIEPHGNTVVIRLKGEPVSDAANN